MKNGISIECGYCKNEFTAMYVDEFGEMQIMLFDAFEQGVEFLENIRKCGTNIIGVVTTALYVNCINKD